MLDTVFDNPLRGTDRPPLATYERPTLPPGQFFKVQWSNEIVKRRIDWLWEKYIPRGLLTMITGDPSAGKSTLMCEVLAAVSQGRQIAGESTPLPHGNSWLLSAEDGAETTITWRLDNQKADTARICITDSKTDLQSDAALAEFEDFIKRGDFQIVVIDTLTTWMGGDIDMNAANEVMGWLNKFAAIAKRTNCAIVFLRHKRKGGGGNKLYQGMGSIGFTGSVRSELMVTTLNDGTRKLERIKGNYGADPDVLYYRIEPSDDPANIHGVLRWGPPGVPTRTPRERLEDAKDWLLDQLADGPQLAQQLLDDGLAAGFKEQTLRRAKAALKARSYQEGREWWWELPETAGEGVQMFASPDAT